jgi:solute carrier family 39 (zinc transporter), member 1/2/3
MALIKRHTCSHSHDHYHEHGPAPYSTGDHVAGLFIILIISIIGAAFPVVAKRIPRARLHPGFYFACKHLGTGVLLGTSIAHLLPITFESFRDVAAVQKTVPFLPAILIMVGAFTIFTTEALVEGRAYSSLREDMTKNDDTNNSPDESIAEARPEISASELRSMATFIYLLEASIMFHSIFVGIAISIATEGFWLFLIAFVFHQLFEGLGLGARIAQVPFKRGSYRPWLLVAGFALTAPTGQAIGLGFQASLRTDSDRFSVVNGTFNGISAGMLLYASFVSLLFKDFRLSDEIPKGRKWGVAFGLVILGALVMTVLSKWA